MHHQHRNGLFSTQGLECGVDLGPFGEDLEGLWLASGLKKKENRVTLSIVTSTEAVSCVSGKKLFIL